MIVVDTNILAYFYLPSEHTADVVALLHRDPQWLAPLLWRSEFRNILSTYLRRQLIDMNTALMIQAQAERQLDGNEYSVNSTSVLTLATQSGCSAHDCEFVSMALALNVPLVTQDRQLLQAFPQVAVTAREFMSV
jgi:predicted nucleic acid-binding protein